MVMGEVRPGVAVGAVVLAHRSPLALAEVRTPQVPVAGTPQPVLELAEPLGPRPFCTSHRRRSRRCSPTRMPLAIAVRAGFTAPMLGKELVSTT
jgi:hypothetical protein